MPQLSLFVSLYIKASKNVETTVGYNNLVDGKVPTLRQNNNINRKTRAYSHLLRLVTNFAQPFWSELCMSGIKQNNYRPQLGINSSVLEF